MSDWIKHLKTPKGASFTWGGMDRDFEWGDGSALPDEPTRPSVSMSTLPDGFFEDAEEAFEPSTLMATEGMDLAHLVPDSDTKLIDLEWLGEDPSFTLPINPVNLGIQELKEQWGRGASFQRVEAVEHDSRAPETIDTRKIKLAMQKAVRDVHFGATLDEVKRDLVSSLGEHAVYTKAAVDRLSDDVGLAGKVFIRASAFPGLRKGKWVDTIKQKAPNARYVISEDQTVGQKLGMKAVREVPWGKALRKYSPRLHTAGQQLDSRLDPKEALRSALAQREAAFKTRVEDQRPTTIAVADTVSSKEALREFKASTPEPLVQIEPSQGEQKRKAALARLSKLAKAGVLSVEDVVELRALDTETMLKQAMRRISKVSESTYEGSGLVQDVHAQGKRKAGSRTDKGVSYRELKAELPAPAKLAKHWMNEGLMGEKLTRRIQAKWAPDTLKATAAAIREVRASHEGFAGNVYVDAETYASDSGADGCKKASQAHKPTNVPAVLSMDRCSSCAHRQVLKNGAAHCAVYDKILIKPDDLQGMGGVKTAAIKKANAKKKALPIGESPVEQYEMTSHMAVDLNASHSPDLLNDITFGEMHIGDTE